MPRRGDHSSAARSRVEAPLTAGNFADRFMALGSLLWTVAAGVLGDPTEADDVLQEAGMMAFKKLDQYEQGTNLQAWLAQFVRNVALNHARKKQVRTLRSVPFAAVDGLGAESPTIAASEKHPVDAAGELRADQAAFDDRVLGGLRSLGALQRSCLLLRSVQELSYREIATTLGIPEGTAMSHVHRARTLLRERLSEQAPEEASIRQREEERHA